MKSWFQNLSSPDWWIGVVIVGVLINLFSAYLKKPADRLLSVCSKRWATRTERRREERELRIQKLRSSRDEQAFALMEALHVRVRSVMFYLLGCTMIVFATVLRREPVFELLFAFPLIFEFIGLLSVMFGLHNWWDMIRRLSEIDEARNPAA